MELTISEIGILNYHMHLMRKSVKKGFKRSYGAPEGKVMLDVYDSVCNGLVSHLAHLHLEDKDEDYIQTQKLEIGFTDDQKVMLHSFLDFYTKSLLEQSVKEGVKVKEIPVLLDISIKVKENVA